MVGHGDGSQPLEVICLTRGKEITFGQTQLSKFEQM